MEFQNVSEGLIFWGKCTPKTKVKTTVCLSSTLYPESASIHGGEKKIISWTGLFFLRNNVAERKGCVRVSVRFWRGERLEKKEHSSPPGKPELSRWEGTQGSLLWSERRARASRLAPAASSAPWSCARTPDSAWQVGGWEAWVFFAKDAHLEGKLSLFVLGFRITPSPIPYHFYADHTPDDELAAQLPASCLTREHQQADGLALSSLLLLQPRGLGKPVGVRVGRG